MGSRKLPHSDASYALNLTSVRKLSEVKARAVAPSHDSPRGCYGCARWFMPNAATTSRSLSPAGRSHQAVGYRTGLRLRPVRQTGAPAEFGQWLSRRAPVRGPARLV